MTMYFFKKCVDRISTNRYLFFISFSLLYFYYILKYPTLSYKSEVWAEHGTNYLYHAYNSSLLTNLFKTDAGYLVWLPRIIALITSYISSPFYFIYITNFIGLAIISYCASFINRRNFKHLIPSDGNRFFLSLMMGVFLFPHYENFTFINFSYYGFLFCLFLIFMKKEYLPRKEFLVYSVLNALFVISKSQFIAFLPVFLVAMWCHFKKGERKSALFFLPSIITLLIQIVSILLFSQRYVLSKTAIGGGPSSVISQMAKGFFIWTQGYAVNFEFLKFPVLTNSVSWLVIIFYFFWLYRKYSKGQMPLTHFLLPIVFNLVALGYVLISTMRHFLNDGFGFDVVYFSFGRASFLVYPLMWVSAFIVFSNYKKRKIPLVFLVYVAIFVHPSNLTIGDDSYYRTISSNWERYHVLADEKKFLIPINPFRGHRPWAIKRGIDKIKEYNNNEVQNPIVIKNLIKENKVNSILVHYPHFEMIKAEAFIGERKIAEANSLSDLSMKYKYIWFNAEGISPEKIVLLNDSEIEIKFSEVIIFGHKRTPTKSANQINGAD